MRLFYKLQVVDRTSNFAFLLAFNPCSHPHLFACYIYPTSTLISLPRNRAGRTTVERTAAAVRSPLDVHGIVHQLSGLVIFNTSQVVWKLLTEDFMNGGCLPWVNTGLPYGDLRCFLTIMVILNGMFNGRSSCHMGFPVFSHQIKGVSGKCPINQGILGRFIPPTLLE